MLFNVTHKLRRSLPRPPTILNGAEFPRAWLDGLTEGYINVYMHVAQHDNDNQM